MAQRAALALPSAQPPPTGAVGQFDEKLGWTKDFASFISDRRVDPEHSVLSIVRQRVFGILAGYEDQNDHDTLRSDPVFKLISGREPGDGDLASQPTISRLENAVTAGTLLKMEAWYVERFVKAATRIVVSTRRVLLQLSANWPHLKYFRHVAEQIDRYRPIVA